MTTHSIEVLLQDMKVRITTPELEIQSGDTVQWIFRGVPEKVRDAWVPGIVFLRPSPHYAGPFEALRQTAEAVSGVRSRDKAGRFPYMAILRDWRQPRLSLLTSDPAAIWQEAMDVDVRVDLEAATFDITPNDVRAGEPDGADVDRQRRSGDRQREGRTARGPRASGRRLTRQIRERHAGRGRGEGPGGAGGFFVAGAMEQSQVLPRSLFQGVPCTSSSVTSFWL
jgi:hypothetical protein